MLDLDEISETLRNQLKDSENKIKSLKKIAGTEKFEASNNYQKQLKKIKDMLETYDYAIKDTIDQENFGVHKSQLAEYRSEYKQLEELLEFNRNEQVSQKELFKHRNYDSHLDGNDRPQMIQRGHQKQEETHQTVKKVVKITYDMDEAADILNVELERQIYKLDSIYDNMKDTETTLKRAEKHLKYFAKQVYTDRLMICLIVLIIIAIIVIIILKIMGKTPQISIENLK